MIPLGGGEGLSTASAKLPENFSCFGFQVLKTVGDESVGKFSDLLTGRYQRWSMRSSDDVVVESEDMGKGLGLHYC